MSGHFPVLLDLRGRRCLVVGGGSIGERKASALVECGARVTVVGPTITPALADLVRSRRLAHRARAFRAADLRGTILAIAATGIPAVDDAVAAAARRHRVILNVVDRPDRCDFILPSVLRRGPLQIAVSTGGRSPALAREIRRGLETLFPPDYGDFVERVGAARRRARARAGSAPARLQAAEDVVRRALGSGRRRLGDGAGSWGASAPRREVGVRGAPANVAKHKRVRPGMLLARVPRAYETQPRGQGGAHDGEASASDRDQGQRISRRGRRPDDHGD